MRVLAIDTALHACSAALLDTSDGALLAHHSRPMAQGHAEALIPLLAEIMKEAGCSFRKLDRIAVTVGPGSFTGLRVGISAARGLSLAASIPAVGLSTLAAFAAPHLARRSAKVIVSAVDARHGRVYLQIFAEGRSLLDPTLVPVEDAVRAAIAGSALIVGSGTAPIVGSWPAGEAPPSVEATPAPDIAWVARLGATLDAQGAPPAPLYLTHADARPQDAARVARR